MPLIHFSTAVLPNPDPSRVIYLFKWGASFLKWLRIKLEKSWTVWSRRDWAKLPKVPSAFSPKKVYFIKSTFVWRNTKDSILNLFSDIYFFSIFGPLCLLSLTHIFHLRGIMIQDRLCFYLPKKAYAIPFYFCYVIRNILAEEKKW